MMQLNGFGTILYDTWFNLKNHYRNLRLDEFVIMPNHFHGIMIIDNNNGNVDTGFKPVSTNTETNTNTHIPTKTKKPS